MRFLFSAVVFLLSLAAFPVVAPAGVLYRCVGGEGVVYTSTRHGHCTRALSWSSPTGSARPAPASASPPPARLVRTTVYRVEHANGITEYTDTRPRGASFRVLSYMATCIACDVGSAIDFARTALVLDAYRGEVSAAAQAYGIDGALLRAVIHAESAFDPLALSAKGARGLMQLMPGTAADLGVEDAFDAAQNILGGARYLGRLLGDFGGDVALATAAYNAGPAAVRKYGGIPPYEETQAYVRRVATLRARYAAAR